MTDATQRPLITPGLIREFLEDSYPGLKDPMDPAELEECGIDPATAQLLVSIQRIGER